MRRKERNDVEGYVGFFLICLSHDNMFNYYKTNFALMQHHNYSLTELESMIPWEREVYVTMLIEYIKEENERIRQQQSG